ncbi:MAG: hypothetical protein ACTSO7_02415 [Candidatus Heimdallarchaeota archaeon]
MVNLLYDFIDEHLYTFSRQAVLDILLEFLAGLAFLFLLGVVIFAMIKAPMLVKHGSIEMFVFVFFGLIHSAMNLADEFIWFTEDFYKIWKILKDLSLLLGAIILMVGFYRFFIFSARLFGTESDKEEDDDDEDELEEVVEEVAEAIEEADEDFTEDEIIDEVVEEVAEETLEDVLEDTTDEAVDEDVIEDIAEEIAEEVTTEEPEVEITEVTEETDTEPIEDEIKDEVVEEVAEETLEDTVDESVDDDVSEDTTEEEERSTFEDEF